MGFINFRRSIIISFTVLLLFIITFIFRNEISKFTDVIIDDKLYTIIGTILASVFGASVASYIVHLVDRSQISSDVFSMLENNSVFRRLSNKEIEDSEFLLGTWKQYKITRESYIDVKKITIDKFTRTSYNQIHILMSKVKMKGEKLKEEEFHQGYVKKRFLSYVEYEVFGLPHENSIAGDYIRNTVFIVNKNYPFTICKSESINYDNEPYTTFTLLIKQDTKLAKYLNESKENEELSWEILQEIYEISEKVSKSNTMTMGSGLIKSVTKFIDTEMKKRGVDKTKYSDSFHEIRDTKNDLNKQLVETIDKTKKREISKSVGSKK